MKANNSKSPNIRINKVYTRTGDGGKTRLVGGEETYKDSTRVEAYGAVDELNAHLGMCREMVKNMNTDSFLELIDFLHTVQNELFNLGTQLAAPESKHSGSLPGITADAVEMLENEIDKARDIILAFDTAKSKGIGVVSMGSKMIDPPVVKRAQHTINLSLAMSLIPKNWKHKSND